ncbi:hypothetical protein BC941DRAFT_476721 [Chlamydoabsidia padenii]|nr:hypothetical protein BC941DRAFT_476721 [Chlamydoabsidia padenii]
MVDLKVLTTSVADYMLKKMSKYLDMDKEFREELTEKAIAYARDRASLCKGTTVAGSLCSRSAKDNTGYCFQHVPKEKTVSHAARRKSKKKTRKHRKEETDVKEVEEVETDVEEKRLEFKGGRQGLLPQQVLARARVFPKRKYQRRYYGMITLWRNVDSLLHSMYMGGFASGLHPRERTEAEKVVDKLRFQGEAILDDMEEEGKCHSSQVKEYTKAVEHEWNEVFGGSVRTVDTEDWKAAFERYSTHNSESTISSLLAFSNKH